MGALVFGATDLGSLVLARLILGHRSHPGPILAARPVRPPIPRPGLRAASILAARPGTPPIPPHVESDLHSPTTLEEGVFNQKLQLQRGVLFRHEFGREPLHSASRAANDRGVSFVLDGETVLEAEPW